MLLLPLALIFSAAPAPNGVDGGLPFAQVKDVLDWHARDVAQCVGGAKGSARYTFSISPDGTVSGLRLRDSTQLAGRDLPCVGSMLQALRFTRADAGTRVEWTLVPGPALALDAGVQTRDPASFPPEWQNDAAECYAQEVGQRPEGRLALEVMVGASGAVLEARAVPSSPEFARFPVANCLTERARGWAFPTGRPRVEQTHWLFARNAAGAARLLVADEPAAEVLAVALPLVSAGLPKASIVDVVKQKQELIKGCFDLARATQPKLAGSVRIHFRIGPDGSVKFAEVVEDTTHSTKLTSCMLDLLRTYRFPEPEGGATVDATFPWVFKAP